MVRLSKTITYGEESLRLSCSGNHEDGSPSIFLYDAFGEPYTEVSSFHPGLALAPGEFYTRLPETHPTLAASLLSLYFEDTGKTVANGSIWRIG